MPSNSKSPYAASFRSAINRGHSASKAVQAIAKRSGKAPSSVFSSLHKAELCDRQKFNGQWVYWPHEGIKPNASNAKDSQLQVWQNLIDWSILSGQCKPEQLNKNAGSQKQFMSYCRKFWNHQYGAATTVSKPSSRKSSARKITAKPRSTSTRKRTAATSYKIPGQTARKYRRVA